MKRYYLDANGSSKALKEVREKVSEALPFFGNPSSFHEHGRALRAGLDEAREHVAKAVGAKAKELIFTSGASESNRLFVDSLLKKFVRFKPKILCSPFEHPSLLKPLQYAHDAELLDLSIMEIAKNQLILKDLEKYDAIVCCQAHNETGIIPDMSFLDEIKANTIVMSDIAQGFSRLEKPDARIDVLSFSAQKMGGFSGAGCLVFRGKAKNLPPPWLGGGQERGMRPGTESFLLISAFGEAARLIDRERELNQKLKSVRDLFEAKLKQKFSVKIVGEEWLRLPNTTAVTFLGMDPDALRIGCDMAGLSVGFGAACSGLAPEGSFALKRFMSLQEEKTTVRFSLCTDTTIEDMEEVLKRLEFINHKSRA